MNAGKKHLFAPGCALILYKPHLIRKLHAFLNTEYGRMDLLMSCCTAIPDIPAGTTVINVCPGCDRRYRQNYTDSGTVSLWELLAENDHFPFPDHGGRDMTIIDACPTRDQERVHNAVRALADKMNIHIVEPAQTRTKSTCCGDTFYGNLPTEKVVEQMKQKADRMPLDDIIVYCVSCSKSMFNGGKRPGYLVDLLFNETTEPQTTDPDHWHAQLDSFMEIHGEYETVSEIRN